MVIDTLRRDHVSCYGDRADTPHIDALADRGRRYTRVYSAYHQTTMSMAAFITGRTPSLESGDPKRPITFDGRTWCGMRRFADDEKDACIPAELETLAESLRDAGYATLGVTSNDLLYRPAGYDQGFDDWIEVGRGHTGDREKRMQPALARAGAAVNRSVAGALDRRRSDHFFLYVHYMDVHDHAVRGMSYAEGVREADAALGELLRLLRARKLLEGATVLVTSDHGERLGERHQIPGFGSHLGNPSYEYLLRLPLVVAPAPSEGDDSWLRGQEVFDLVRRIAGLRVASGVAELEPDEQFLSEIGWQTYRRGRWKSTFSRDSDEHALFDLATDPGETADVAAEHPGILEAHRRRIATLSQQLAAPDAPESRLTDEDRERLRALGYAE